MMWIEPKLLARNLNDYVEGPVGHPLLKFFDPKLSHGKQFQQLAFWVIENTHAGSEQTVALRKLLESMDAIARAVK